MHPHMHPHTYMCSRMLTHQQIKILHVLQLYVSKTVPGTKVQKRAAVMVDGTIINVTSDSKTVEYKMGDSQLRLGL